MPYTADLEDLLVEGSKHVHAEYEYVMERHRVEDVVLPTGHVAACDPLTACDRATAFTATVPPGVYSAWVWVAVQYRDGQVRQRRNAAIQLVISEVPAARWEMALTAAQDLDDLGADHFFGFGVDAGCATIADMTAIRAVAGWEWEQLDDTFIPSQLPEAPVPGHLTAIVESATGANMVTVSSGWGDGVYPTWVGRDQSGAVASFVVDFLLLP